MTESFLNHASCGLQEMKEIATNATGVMSDATREVSLAPQFIDAVSRYESGAKTYRYDCMPLLDGNFHHQFIVSSVCGQPTMETIDLKNLDFSAVGLSLAAQSTDIADIKSEFNNLQKELKAVNAKIGNETQLTAAQTKLFSAINDLMNQIDEVYNKIDNATPELSLSLGGTISDSHMDTISELKTAYTSFKDIADAALAAWDMTAPGGADPSVSGAAIKTSAEAILADLVNLVTDKFEPVETVFVYDTSQVVKVNTYSNAVAAEAVIDAGLTATTNAITKVQGQQNALNSIAMLAERNVLLQNKVASEYGSVDPIETNARISTNKLELERAVCALKEYQNMEQAFSRYLSQCV
jgi:archaellum component FlaC